MQIPANDMPQSIQAPSGFQLTNLTNRQSKTDAESKKTLQERFRKLSSAQETQNQNVQNRDQKSSLTCVQKESQSRPLGSENVKPESKGLHSGPALSKSLKKVNVDYFRGKKVQFKHANVRISFEIVDSLF